MRKILLTLIAVLCISFSFAQNKQITGIVTSSTDGEPVIGASVAVKEIPTLGTATDFDGKFVFASLPSQAKTLVISFIGMVTKEVPISPDMKIVLDDDTEFLEDVVVVAYGTAKKSAFTGSASVINSDKISEVQTSNVLEVLKGKSAGVQMFNTSGAPGQTSPSIRIRGISSINAGNAPLIIVDGAPYDGDMNNINSQDIESMTVLKDAASNALYGARGSNGVIMITTKKGRAGENARITIDTKLGSNSRATQRYNTINDPAQYYEVYYKALKNYALKDGKSETEAHKWANNNLTASNDYGLNYNVYNVPAGQYLIGVNGKLNPNATMGNIVNYEGKDYMLCADDWLEAAFKKGFNQEYNFSATQASDRSSFYTSFGYLNTEGITQNSDYERYTGRLKADSQLKKWLKAEVNISFAHFNSNSLDEDGVDNSSGNIFAAATQVAPIYPLYLRDKLGNIMKDETGNQMFDYGDKSNAGFERPVFTGSNALSDAILNVSNDEGNAMNSTGSLEVKFLKNFTFTSTNSFNMDETRSTALTNPYYGSYSSSNGILTKSHKRGFSTTYQQILKYSKIFDEHDVDIMVGHEAYVHKTYYLEATKNNMFDPSNLELSGAITDGTPDSYTTQYNHEGYFSRAQYNYDETYFGSVSYRRDASSRFHPDNRWGNFWSAGGAWIISKESWFNIDLINSLKFKLSYGEQGNDNIGDYRYINTYDIVNSNGQVAAIPKTMGNKDISWEKNGNFNVGFEFELINSRLTGSIDYFFRSTNDMLFSFPLPDSYGYSSYYANVGDMKNKGVEIDLGYDIIKKKDFNWNVNINATAYKNEITKLSEKNKTTTVDGYNGYESGDYFFGEGLSIFTWEMKQFAGLDANGASLWYKNSKDGNGNIIKVTTADYSKADDYLCGTALPDLYGGFGTSIYWKGFDFSIDFSYQIGGLVYDNDYSMMMSNPVASNKASAIHADVLNAWVDADHGSSEIPLWIFGDENAASRSDRFLTDASYLSLNNINIGYSIPKDICKKAGIEKIRLYATADNVWLWSKRQGLDPRQSIDGEVTSTFYAPIRTISGGITLTF